MVEFHLVLGLVEVVFVALDNANRSFAGGNITDIAALAIFFGQDLGVVFLGVVSELDWSDDGTLKGVVSVDVLLALVTICFDPVNTELGEETSNVVHELDCLLPGTDVLVDLIEQVADASRREFQ